MSKLYDLAIVGAGLSALSALQAGIASARTVVLDYQEHPGGFLKAALPAPGFEEAWELVQSSRIPQRVTTFYGTTAVGLLPAFEAGEPHVLIVRQRQGTEEVHAQRVLIACGGLELTREHAQIPGTRPAGVITPVLAHQLLSRGYLPGKRAVVYGDSRYARCPLRRHARLPSLQLLTRVDFFMRAHWKEQGEARRATIGTYPSCQRCCAATLRVRQDERSKAHPSQPRRPRPYGLTMTLPITLPVKALRLTSHR